MCFSLHGQWIRGDKCFGEEPTLDDDDDEDYISKRMRLNEYDCPGGGEYSGPLSQRIDTFMPWLRALGSDAWGQCYAIEIVMSYWVLQNLVRVMDVEDLLLPKWRKDFWPEFCYLLPPKTRFLFVDVLDGYWKDSTKCVNLLGNSMKLGSKEDEDERKLVVALDCARAGWMKNLLPHFRELVALRVQLKYYFGFEQLRVISYKKLESIEENLARFNGMMKEKLSARASSGAKDMVRLYELEMEDEDKGIMSPPALGWR